MVWACEKNVNQQDCPEVAGMEAKHRQRRQAGRPRGRPRTRRMENIKKAVEVRGSTLNEIEQSISTVP